VAGSAGTDAGAGRALAAESVAAGLAGSAGLCCASTALVGSFRPYFLPVPYWYVIPLRTDTCGALAFFLTAVTLVASKYLRLRRLAAGSGAPVRNPGPSTWLTVAVAETAGILAAGLVVYLSVNAVTHPQTLELQATHFAQWPTEGTLRVIALAVLAVSVAVRRYTRARFAVTGLLPAGHRGRAGAGPASGVMASSESVSER
jgi:hypothetical protein